MGLIDRIRRAGQSGDPNRQALRSVVDELDAEVAGRWGRLVCVLRGDPNAPREAGFAAATKETRRISASAKGLAAEAARQRYVALADRLGQATGSAWAIWLASGGEASAATAKLKALQQEFPEHAAFAEAKLTKIKAAWEMAVKQNLQPGTFRQAHETSRELIDHYPEDVRRFSDEIRTEWLAHVRGLADAEMEKPKPEERSFQAAAEQAKGLDSLFPGETDAAKYVRKTETQTRFAIHLDTSARKVPAPGTDFPEALRALADCRKEADAAEAILLEQEALFDAAEAGKLRDQLDAANRKVGAATAATLDKEIDARLAAARQAASGPGADFPAAMAELVKAEGLQVQMGELAEAGDQARATAQRTDACRAEVGRAWSAAVEKLLAGSQYAEAATQCRQMGTFACFQQASAGLRAKLEQAAWQSPPEHKADLDAHADRGEAALRAQRWSDANTAYTAAVETLGRYRDFCRTNGIAPLADSALDANGAPERSGASAAQAARRLGCARALQRAKQMHADRKWQPARSALAEGGQLAQASGVAGLEGVLQQWAGRLDYRLALEKYEKTMQDARKAKDDGQLPAAIEMFSQADAMMGDVTRKEILAVQEMLDRSPQTAPPGTSWSGVAKANQDGDWHGLDGDRLSPDEKAFNDLWKTPYRLARDPQTGRATLYSCGPNRKDENGSGDDITAGP